MVFEETDELTEALPVPTELLEEVAEATSRGRTSRSDGPDALPTTTR